MPSTINYSSPDPPPESTSQSAAELRTSGKRSWIARLGVLGFAFFFLKGLLWLIVPALLASLTLFK